jgi:hypothetical protein
VSFTAITLCVASRQVFIVVVVVVVVVYFVMTQFGNFWIYPCKYGLSNIKATRAPNFLVLDPRSS